MEFGCGRLVLAAMGHLVGLIPSLKTERLMIFSVRAVLRLAKISQYRYSGIFCSRRKTQRSIIRKYSKNLDLYSW